MLGGKKLEFTIKTETRAISLPIDADDVSLEERDALGHTIKIEIRSPEDSGDYADLKALTVGETMKIKLSAYQDGPTYLASDIAALISSNEIATGGPKLADTNRYPTEFQLVFKLGADI